MAGHSKWAQIKRKKAVTDARRGQLWTRILKEVTVAARLGGGDPAGNPRLRSAIDDAKANNVPNDNIDRAVQRGTGELEGVDYEEAVFEGYAPGGVAVLVETVTDNRNRTVSELRHLFSRHGGSMGEAGSVAWQFERRGEIALDREQLDEEQFVELALELGVEDLSTDGEAYELYTTVDDFHTVLDRLEERDLAPVSRQLAMNAKAQVGPDADAASRALRLLEVLEEHDDVQHVWANLEVDEEALVG